MDAIAIEGGIPLVGKIEISGAKNSALPLMTACLLTDKGLTLTNLPNLADITTMASLLVNHGVKLTVDTAKRSAGRVIKLDASQIKNLVAPYDIVRKMRASVLVLGPLLARFGEAKVSLPGGCAIGTRPIDLHLMAFEKLGAKISLEEGYIHAKCDDRLKGATIEFPIVSVGATENILMAATLAKGTTIIKNAAREPEIADLANCLNKMGAAISGIDTGTLVIEGVDKLHHAEHGVVFDRIEAGTYAAAAAITGGEIELLKARVDIMQATIDVMEEAGVSFKETEGGILVKRKTKKLKSINVETAPYPGFATDMQAQILALMTIADGESKITETIFENRFMHVPELARMGAKIRVEGKTAFVTGVPELKSATVMATDLRASVSLVLGALATKGMSTINRIYHLDRGYERIEEKLEAVGAKIERVRI